MKGDRIKYWDGYKYQLDEMYACGTDLRPPVDIIGRFYEIHRDGTVIAKVGYAWDGPSGPTFDTKNFMRGSLIHDILYQAMREKRLPEIFREMADITLQEICIEDGMSRLRAWWVFQAVRRFGGVWNQAEDKVHTAP